MRRVRCSLVGFTLACMSGPIILSSTACDSGKPAATAGAKSPSTGEAAGGSPSPGGTQTKPPPPPDWFGDAVIEGFVKLGTPLPQARPFQVTADPVCARLNAGKQVFPQSRESGKAGELPHVFVYVKRGIDGKYTPPSDPVILDQRSCMYVPHIFGILCGQTLEIRNGDPTTHNVHALPRKNDGFNIAQANQGAVAKKTFNKPEVMLKFKCDVHSWMDAYAGVLTHPFFAVTGSDGTFRIDRLPPGQYTIEAWHELFGTLQQDVTVSDGQPARAEFTFKKGP